MSDDTKKVTVKKTKKTKKVTIQEEATINDGLGGEVKISKIETFGGDEGNLMRAIDNEINDEVEFISPTFSLIKFSNFNPVQYLFQISFNF